MRSLYRVGLAGLLLLVVLSGVCAQDKRVALVIGNGAYQTGTVPPLANPPNDAADMAQTLRSIGFAVTEVVDGTREEMEIAVSMFGRSLYDADVSLFFYAGHGVQVDGSNYLVPVDARLDSAEVIPFRTVAADQVLAFMESANTTLNLFFLDACRDNPLPQSSRSVSRGLAVVGRRPPETMIMYATAAGDTAADGQGRNSPFTSALIKYLPTPNLDIYDLFRNVSSDVQAMTAGAQRPEQYGNVSVRYSLVGSAEAASAADQAKQSQASPQPGSESGEAARDAETQQASFDTRLQFDPIRLARYPHERRVGVMVEALEYGGSRYPLTLKGYRRLVSEVATEHPQDESLQQLFEGYGKQLNRNRALTIGGCSLAGLGIGGAALTALGWHGLDSNGARIGAVGLSAACFAGGMTMALLGAIRLEKPPQDIINYYNETYAAE